MEANGLVDGRQAFLARLRAEVAEEPEAKYLDMALRHYEEAAKLKEELSRKYYTQDKLETYARLAEELEKTVELLVKAVMVGEDTALALKKLESALTKNAHVRTQILTLLMSHPDGLTFKEIKETLKKSDESINQALQALILLGYVEKLGKYKLKPGVRDGIFRVLWTASDELLMEMRRKGL